MKRPTARQSAWQWQERIGVRDRKTLDGDQSLFFNRLMDLGDPLEDYDAVNKKYVDDVFGDGEIIVVIGSVDDIADLDLDPGSIAGSDADAVMAVHLAMYDHTLIGSGGVDLTEHLAAYDHTNIHPSNIIDGDTIDVAGRVVDDVLSWDGSKWIPATLKQWSINETPSGIINGINVTFILAHIPVGQIMLYLNGLYMSPGVGEDYTISGLTITMTVPLIEGDKIRTNYMY